MSDILVVTSKVKALGKVLELRTSAEAIEKLSQIVELKYNEAAEKAKAANRKTVMAEDFQ
jgi:histone H3/H4